MHTARLELHPHILDAAPLSPLVEPWPDGASWVCVYLSDRVRLLVGPHARWSLVREGIGRVAVGWVDEV